MADTSLRFQPNWRVAAGLSLIPGLGQLYNRQGAKALRMFLTTVALIAVAFALLMLALAAGPFVYNHFGLLFLPFALAAIAAFLALFVAGLFYWGSAAVDAAVSAKALCSGEDASAISFFRFA